MMPPPPQPRRSDPNTSYPSRPPVPPSSSSSQRPSLGMYPRSSSSTAQAPIISPSPHMDNRSSQLPFLPLISSQSGRKEGEEEEEEGEYESYGSTAYAQPQVRPLGMRTGNLAFEASQSQSQTQNSLLQSQLQTQSLLPSQIQSSHILVPETSHIPRRQPKPSAQMDLMGDFSPPTTIPPPSRQSRPESIIPDTQQHRPPLLPPKRIDTYRPQSAMATAERRPINPWQASPTRSEAMAWPIQHHERRSISVMPGPSASPTRSAGRGAAEVFMAATITQGGKTNSEKIMSALSEWSNQILEVIGQVQKDQKQIRDQVHEVQTGQRALATREEVVEEITAQLSPALHEFFLTLHTKIDSTVSPLSEETATLAAEKIKAILVDMKQVKASQRSQDDVQEKPIIKLIDHLISKLDDVSSIHTFLTSFKDLPEAISDVAIFKQSLDALKRKVDTPVTPAVDPSIIQNVQHGINAIYQQMAEVVRLGSGRVEGEDRVIGAINALAKGMGQLIPPQPQIQAPAEISEDVGYLREKVDSLSAGMETMKASLNALLREKREKQEKQPILDVEDIVAKLKVALIPHLVYGPLESIPQVEHHALPIQRQSSPPHESPLSITSLLNPAPTPSSPYSPAADSLTLLDQEMDHNQNDSYNPESTDMGTQTQTQPLPDKGQVIRPLFSQKPFYSGTSSTTIAESIPIPPIVPVEPPAEVAIITPAEDSNPPNLPSSAAEQSTPRPQSKLSSATSMTFNTVDGTFSVVGHSPSDPATSSDVFGPLRSLSTTADMPMLGAGDLGITMEVEEEHDLDDYGDLFEDPKQNQGSKGKVGKGKGKRTRGTSSLGQASSASVSDPSSATDSARPVKRVRTRTAAPPSTVPTLPTQTKPKGRLSRSTQPTSSTTLLPTVIETPPNDSPSSPLSPKKPGRKPQSKTPTQGLGELSGDTYSPTALTGTYFKRSLRVEAIRTASNNPIYNSNPPPVTPRGLSKTIKQEIIEGEENLSPTEFGGFSGAGSSKSAAIAINDSPIDLTDSPPTDETLGKEKEASSLTEMQGSGSLERVQVERETGSGGDGDQTQALFSKRKDPPPMAVTTRYGKRRIDQIQYGSDSDD